MGTWTSGGALITSRWSLRACGLQTAGLAFGGRNGGIHCTTEEYNGTAWTAAGDLLHMRQLHGACGTQGAGLGFGGSDGVTYLKSTEEYNGTAWSSGGDLSTTVGNHAGAGLQSAALSFGGSVGAATNEYNGTAWTSGGDLIKSRYKLGGCGLQAAGLSLGGYDGINYLANTEEYNGIAWSAGGDLLLARGDLSSCGTQIAGVSFGGYIKYSTVKNTEEYDGAAWATSGDMITATRWHAGCGTLVAGLSVITNRTEEYAGTAPPVQAYSLARSKTSLCDIWIRSFTDLEECPLTGQIPSFWFLRSMSGYESGTAIPRNKDNPTLHKVPFRGVSTSLTLYFGESVQKYHSFTFEEYVDSYFTWGTYILQHEKCWAYDQHNNHLAILAKGQKAVHVYDLNSEVEDIIFSLQAEEFVTAVGLAFSDGRIDVFVPTVHSSGSTPGHYFLFDPVNRGSGGYLPDIYSFNIDGTPIDGPVLYSKGAVESKTYFGTFTVLSPIVLSKAALENPVFIPAWSKLTFVEDQYGKSKTALDNDLFAASKCALEIEVLEGCHSKSCLNALNPDYCPRSKTSFADSYEWGLQARVAASRDYLLVGLMSNIYTGSLEDANAAFYLALFDRNTRKCIWSKSLKVSNVTGTTLYDGWLWEDIKTKDGYTHIFTEGKFEIELFDCFGTPRIALARHGKLNAPYIRGTVWEEYDIDLDNPCNINLVTGWGTSDLLYPTGFIFKRRGAYDFPVKTGEPKKDYLCYTLRSKSDFTEGGTLELFQRDQADGYHTFAGSVGHSNFVWLVALCHTPSCPFVKSTTSLNIDFSSILSKALLRIANPCIGTSGVIGQVDLEESLIKIIQSKTTFDDSWFVQSKVFMDDFLVRSSTDFIDNKDLAFPARYVIGSHHLSTGPTDDPGGPGIRPSVVAIIRIGDDNKAYHSMTCKVWSGAQALFWCRPAIIGNYAYYVVREMLFNIAGPPWDLPHYFLWKVNLNTYEGTHKLPLKLYYKGTGVWPDIDFYSVDYLVELAHAPLGAEQEAQPLVYLQGRLFYIYNDSGVYGIAYIWLNSFVQGGHTLGEILPEFTKVVSLDTDGTYLYVLGYKSDIEGLWLIKLNLGLTKVDELVIFKGRLHTGSGTYNAQVTFWDSVNNQFVIGIAPIAGRIIDTGALSQGYGAIVYSPVDGSIKWWKNFCPTGLAVHTMSGLNTIYFQRKRDDTIGIYTTHGDYKGIDLDVTDLSGGARFDMRGAQIREVDIETSVQSKTILIRSAEEQDNLFPDIPGPTQVPREQRFVV